MKNLRRVLSKTGVTSQRKLRPVKSNAETQPKEIDLQNRPWLDYALKTGIFQFGGWEFTLAINGLRK